MFNLTNEQYYQSLYQQNPDLILTFDLEGNFLGANKVIESYGYTECELLHQPFIPYVASDELEKTIEYFNQAKRGKSTNFDTAIYDKKGNRIEFNVQNIPIIIDEQLVGVYGIVKDITETTIEFMTIMMV